MWWGAPDWDDYCANCYGPFCLCGTDAVNVAGGTATTKTCATCGAAWVPFRRLGDAGAPSWYVSELVKLRQERGETAPPLSNCVVTEEEDRAVLQRMGLAESEVRSLGASPFRAGKST